MPPYQQLVHGLVLPAAVGGASALDFCNTRAGWDPGDEPREYLTSYDHLAVWTRAAGLLDASTTMRLRRRAKREPAEARRTLERARVLRAALYTSCTDARAAGAWDAVAAEARRAAAAAVLVPNARPGRRWLVDENVGLELPVLEVARLAGDFLDATDLRTVGRCPGNDCGWLFLDPRGRRRWCLMAVCGNRAKARRHAFRTRRAPKRSEARG